MKRKKKFAHTIALTFRCKNLFQENDFMSCAQSTLVVDDDLFFPLALSPYILNFTLERCATADRANKGTGCYKESYTLDVKHLYSTMTKIKTKRWN